MIFVVVKTVSRSIVLFRKYLPLISDLRVSWSGVHAIPGLGGNLGGRHHLPDCDVRRQQPCQARHSLHAGDIRVPHLPHLHHGNIHQNGKGMEVGDIETAVVGVV